MISCASALLEHLGDLAVGSGMPPGLAASTLADWVCIPPVLPLDVGFKSMGTSLFSFTIVHVSSVTTMKRGVTDFALKILIGLNLLILMKSS